MPKSKKPKQPKEAAKKKGRPSSFTQATAHLLCTHIAGGKSMRSFCELEGMPSAETVRRWLRDLPDFRAQYAHAREEQADYYADQIIEIADTETDNQRARNRIDARKWRAAKLLPKVYGDKVVTELQGGDKPVEIVSTTRDELFTEINRLAARAAANGSDKQPH